MLSRVDINNLSPIFYDGARPILTVAWSVVIRTTEPVAISVMLPRVTGNVKKSVIIWTSFFAIFVSVLFFILFTTSGDSALLNMFPVHSMAMLSEFGLIERLDVLLTGVWIISAFIKIAFVIYIVNDILQRSFQLKCKGLISYLSGALIFTSVMLLSKNIENFHFSGIFDVNHTYKMFSIKYYSAKDNASLLLNSRMDISMLPVDELPIVITELKSTDVYSP